MAKEFIRCQKWIEDALKHSGGTHETIDVFHAILEGRMQLWSGKDGCAVTELLVYPRKKVLHVFLAGGKMEEIIDFQRDAIEWAKQQGCTAMSIAGRMGWKKVLSEHGWEPKFLTLTKEF